MDAEYYMKLALAAAQEAAGRGEVPVGAALVDADGRVLAVDGNRSIERSDPSAHAEMNVIRRAAAGLGNYRLTGTSLYVTLEPCAMCAGAIVTARIARVFYGAADPKAGAVASLYRIASDPRLNHRAEVAGGIMADEAAGLLRDFFRARRGRIL